MNVTKRILSLAFLLASTASAEMVRVDIGIQGVQPEQCAPGDWNDDQTPDALIRSYTLEYDADPLAYSRLSNRYTEPMQQRSARKRMSGPSKLAVCSQ